MFVRKIIGIVAGALVLVGISTSAASALVLNPGTPVIRWNHCYSYVHLSPVPGIGHAKFVPHVCPPADSFEPPASTLR